MNVLRSQYYPFQTSSNCSKRNRQALLQYKFQKIESPKRLKAQPVFTTTRLNDSLGSWWYTRCLRCSLWCSAFCSMSCVRPLNLFVVGVDHDCWSILTDRLATLVAVNVAGAWVLQPDRAAPGRTVLCVLILALWWTVASTIIYRPLTSTVSEIHEL